MRLSKITKEVSLNKEENRVKSWSVPVIRRYRSDKMSIKKMEKKPGEKPGGPGHLRSTQRNCLMETRVIVSNPARGGQ